MAQFKIGGKVVCIASIKWTSSCGVGKYEIVERKIYTVGDIRNCSCGIVSIDVGIRAPKTDNPVWHSQCVCGKFTRTTVVFVASKYFVPIEETEFKQVTFEKIINEIPVSAQ